MRQVPHYIIIGNGRMAHHIRHYFDDLGISYSSWSRQNDAKSLIELASLSTHALILISDKEIDRFIMSHSLHKQNKLVLIHFSGALNSKYAYSAHPLQSFTPELYSPEQYRNFPFIIDKNSPAFTKLLPGLPNKHYRLSENDLPYYHALCVMANNFTVLLWQKFFTEMHDRFHIEKIDLIPLLKQTLTNLESDHQNAHTGPLKRYDYKTIEANLNALTNDEYQKIYQAFANTHAQKETA